MTSPQRQPASRLEELLRTGRFAITVEITPPVSCEADDLLRKALPLAGLADAVNVTDGAGSRPHHSALITSLLLARRALRPILHFTNRYFNLLLLLANLFMPAP